MEALTDANKWKDPTHLEGMINDADEAKFMDSLKFSLDVEDKKKHGMYILMQNVVVNVVKGGRIQALTWRLAEREEMKNNVLENLGKRL